MVHNAEENITVAGLRVLKNELLIADIASGMKKGHKIWFYDHLSSWQKENIVRKTQFISNTYFIWYLIHNDFIVSLYTVS